MKHLYSSVDVVNFMQTKFKDMNIKFAKHMTNDDFWTLLASKSISSDTNYFIDDSDKTVVYYTDNFVKEHETTFSKFSKNRKRSLNINDFYHTELNISIKNAFIESLVEIDTYLKNLDTIIQLRTEIQNSSLNTNYYELNFSILSNKIDIKTPFIFTVDFKNMLDMTKFSEMMVLKMKDGLSDYLQSCNIFYFQHEDGLIYLCQNKDGQIHPLSQVFIDFSPYIDIYYDIHKKVTYNWKRYFQNMKKLKFKMKDYHNYDLTSDIREINIQMEYSINFVESETSFGSFGDTILPYD